MKLAKLLILVSCFLSLVSCRGTNEVIVVRPKEELFDDAYRYMERRRFAEAAELFLEIENAYPASPFAADALIMGAYAQYMARDFAGTIESIDRFMRFHPGHPDVPYVLYLRGMSFYRQVSDVRRDPGMSGLALNTFGQLVQRFPETEYAKNAENKIVILKNYIAGKMMFSARREMQRHNFTSAINTLTIIVQGMQETQMTPEALFRLSEAYMAIGVTEQAEGFAEMLRLNFPDNEWTNRLDELNRTRRTRFGIRI